MGLTDLAKPRRDSPQVALFKSGIMRSSSGQSSPATTPGSNHASLNIANLSSALQQQKPPLNINDFQDDWNAEPPLNIDEGPGDEDGDFQGDRNDIEHLETKVPDESGDCQDIPPSSQVSADDGEDEQVDEDNESNQHGDGNSLPYEYTIHRSDTRH